MVSYTREGGTTNVGSEDMGDTAAVDSDDMGSV